MWCVCAIFQPIRRVSLRCDAKTAIFILHCHDTIQALTPTARCLPFTVFHLAGWEQQEPLLRPEPLWSSQPWIRQPLRSLLRYFPLIHSPSGKEAPAFDLFFSFRKIPHICWRSVKPLRHSYLKNQNVSGSKDHFVAEVLSCNSHSAGTKIENCTFLVSLLRFDYDSYMYTSWYVQYFQALCHVVITGLVLWTTDYILIYWNLWSKCFCVLRHLNPDSLRPRNYTLHCLYNKRKRILRPRLSWKD